LKTIAIASKNPVKIQAALHGFQRMFRGEAFHIQTISVPSGVSDQPRTNPDTLLGALNRAAGAAGLLRDADYWVGIEGGVEEINGELAAFAWIVVQNANLIGKSRTGTFFLPPRVAQLVKEGKELGEADDIFFSRSNSKQENGAIGILTGNVVDREELYEQAVILALVPFKNETIYSDLED